MKNSEKIVIFVRLLDEGTEVLEACESRAIV